MLRRELNPRAPADITLADYSQVHDLYEAQPTFQHRLWKGPGDLSAKVWFGRGTRGPEGISASHAIKAVTVTVERKGGITHYRMKLPLSLLKASWLSDFCQGFRFNVLVGDNDGEGPECWIQARRGSFKTNDPNRFPLVAYVLRKPPT